MMQRIKTRLKKWLEGDNKTYFKSLLILKSDTALQQAISHLLEKTGLNMAYIIELRLYLTKLACVYQFFPAQENVMELILTQVCEVLKVIKNNPFLSSTENAKAIKPAYICALIIASTAIKLYEVQKFVITLQNTKRLNLYTFDFLEWDFNKPPVITIEVRYSSQSFAMNALLVLNIISNDVKQLIFSYPSVASDFMATLLHIERSTTDSSYVFIQHVLIESTNNIEVNIQPIKANVASIDSSIIEAKSSYKARDFLHWLEHQINQSLLFINDEEGLVYEIDNGWFLTMPEIAKMWHAKIGHTANNPSVLEDILKQSECLSLSNSTNYINKITGNALMGLQIKKQFLNVTQAYPRENLLQQEITNHA